MVEVVFEELGLMRALKRQPPLLVKAQVKFLEVGLVARAVVAMAVPGVPESCTTAPLGGLY